MLAPRLYLLLLKKGVPGTIIFFFLAIFSVVPVKYVALFVGMSVFVGVGVWHVVRWMFKKKTGEETWYRLKFVMKDSFFKILKSYGVLLFLSCIWMLGLICIPWSYLWKMLFVLVFSAILNYWGVITYSRLYLKL